MGTPHISADIKEVAKSVILVNKSEQAKSIADSYLTSRHLINEIRGMLGYTGRYLEREISVFSVGIGIPSVAIYLNELLEVYGVKKVIYISSCFAIQPDIDEKDIVLASGASTDSNFMRHVFNGDFAPIADFILLDKAFRLFEERKISSSVGLLLSVDDISLAKNTLSDVWKRYGVLGVDMATAAVYTLAAKFGAKSLSITSTKNDSLDDKIFEVISTVALNTITSD